MLSGIVIHPTNQIQPGHLCAFPVNVIFCQSHLRRWLSSSVKDDFKVVPAVKPSLNIADSLLHTRASLLTIVIRISPKWYFFSTYCFSNAQIFTAGWDSSSSRHYTCTAQCLSLCPLFYPSVSPILSVCVPILSVCVSYFIRLLQTRKLVLV